MDAKVSTKVLSKVKYQWLKLFLILGPSFNYPHLRFEQSIANGIMSGEVLDKLRRGESLKYKTPYGEGYFSTKDVEDSKQFVLKFEDGIKVGHDLRVNL